MKPPAVRLPGVAVDAVIAATEAGWLTPVERSDNGDTCFRITPLGREVLEAVREGKLSVLEVPPIPASEQETSK